MDNELLDFVEGLQKAEDLDAAWQRTVTYFRDAGAHIVHAWFGSTAETVHWETTCPDWWMEYYIEKNFVVMDHIGKHCATRLDPLLYGSETDEKNPIVPRQFYEMMVDSRDAFGLNQGMAFPCPSPLPQFLGGINLGGELSEIETKKIFAARSGLLQVAATMAHTRLQMLYQKQLRADSNLTPRQKDIILLLANGHRTTEIAYRLNIKEETVVFHLTTARKALGCMTRDQLVAKAIYLGLLTP